MEKNEIILFEAKGSAVKLPVLLKSDTVWLTQAQMAMLFERDRTVISRHIRNAISDGEIDPEVVCAKFAHTTRHGAMEGLMQTIEVEYYNLDVIISVGYRVKSQRGVEFRRWATKMLKDYIVRGYAVNKQRIAELGQAVEVMKRVSNKLDADQILDVVKTYSSALDLLDEYDHQTITKPKIKGRSVKLTYKECRRFINEMKFSVDSTLFGNEKDGMFKSALGAVYQCFGGKDLYPSPQEKAANLLYFITKNHGFSDGNKRIAAGLFLYFLKRNRLLIRKDGSKRISDHTLVALTVMIAESKPAEKEMMINLVMTFLA
ncbi:MAG: virulence protein RhuM/Fic/DOC family protein [Verrucomicrobia bacterium]|nr:virulence protein RhuM/Fic/DOC family protein [Verrucomicrobiota bacterium]